MKHLPFLLFSFLFSLNIQAQKAEFFTDLNLGVPISSSLRNFHTNLAAQIPYENFKTTDNFKINYGFTLGIKILSINTSVFFSNKVSGAKTSVADYSGYLRLTNELKGSTLGIKYDIMIKQLTKGKLVIGLKGLVTKSKLNLKSESKILNDTQNNSLDFKSLDFGTGAGITYEYPLKFIILRAYIDADIYFGGKIQLKDADSDDGYLLNDSGDKVTTGWSGINTGIGIAIPLER